MRALVVAALAAFCGSLGALLWERIMKDAPDWLWRLMFFLFWAAMGLIALFTLTDPVSGPMAAHQKAVVIGFLGWALFGALISQSSRFRSAQLSMRFVRGKSPYEESGIAEVNGEMCNAVNYRVSIESDKTAQVTVTVDGVFLETYERHDIPLHRMGDLTNKETVTEVSKGRPRYWDVVFYVKSQGFIAMSHIQENLPKTLYPLPQSFTITATAPATQEVSRTAKIEVDDAGNLSFSLGETSQ